MNRLRRLKFKRLFSRQQGAIIAVTIIICFLVSNTYLRETVLHLNDPYESAWKPSDLFELKSENYSVTLPEILSDEDIESYKNIFSLQDQEKWSAANTYINKVQNKILMGHVIAQRLLHSYYNPRKDELNSWIAKYSDHPQIKNIIELATKYDPSIATKNTNINQDFLSGYGDGSGLTRSTENSLNLKYWGTRTDSYNLWKKAHYHIRRGGLAQIHSQLSSEKYRSSFTDLELDMLKLSLAEAYFAHNRNREALSIAEEAIIRSGPKIPNIYWVAGISAWRLEKWEQAAKYFSALSYANNISNWDKSAGGFWAYRAYKKIGDTSNAREGLVRANQFPKTFYGTLASIGLGKSLLLEQKGAYFTNEYLTDLLKIPNVERALALTEIGRNSAAEQELRKIYPSAPMDTKSELLGLARLLKIPGLEIRMASVIAGENYGVYDFSLYPIPPWKPERGYRTNPALLFAFIRHESGFNPNAKSNAGAKGLMQLMPNTAEYIASKGNYDLTPSSLLIPEKNMSIGQDYLEYLLDNRQIEGNLFFLAAAYNAGPNSLSRWRRTIEYNDDPLLFIESIPSKETRNFIQRIMSNYWIYRERLGYNTPSIHAVIEGQWPMYRQEQKEEKKEKVAMLMRFLCPIC